MTKSAVVLAVLTFSGLLFAGPTDSRIPRGADATRRVLRSASPPLSFEVNRGQADPEVDFLSRGHGYSLLLSSGGLRLSLAPQGVARNVAGNSVLRMTLVAANPRPRTTRHEEMPEKVNYLLGNDPARWHTNIPTYAKVGYESVYPGVDLIYYGHREQLEYDFVVAPGRDPKVIALEFEGTTELDAAGSLVVRTASGATVQLHKPFVYQETGDARREVGGAYALLGGGRVGFDVGRYDPSRPLVIDPVVSYSTYLGGTGGEAGRAIAVDKAGNAYVTGETTSTDLPGVGSLRRVSGGGTDVFIAKLSADGSRLLYTTYLGGSGADVGYSLTLDASGNIYVTGDTRSTDFPLVKPVQATLGGSADVFVAKLTGDGSQLLYSTYLGGTAGERGLGIAVDASGSACVTGYTQSVDFPTVNALQKAFAGGNADAFVLKLNPAGSALTYSTYLGGGNDRPDIGTGIAADAAGNAYVTGFTNSVEFPTRNPLQPFVGPTDVFVTKLDPGGALVYSTHLGGKADDEAMAIAVDSSGSAYVTGHTESLDFPTTKGAFRTSCVAVAVTIPIGNICSGGDAFISKLSADGSSLLYSTYVNGKQFEVGRGIAVDGNGNAYVTGITSSVDFPVASPLQKVYGGGDFDGFLVKVNPAGSALTYATYLGGGDTEAGYGVAVDAAGNVFITGSTGSRNFPLKRPLSSALRGSSDAFILKIEQTP